MMIVGNKFLQKAFGEYDISSLRTPYMLIALMLNKIFGRENGKFYKMSWIPLIYHVAIQGTIFNRADIVAKNLSSYIAAALGGLTQRKSEFYMGSYLIYVSYSYTNSQRSILLGMKPRFPSMLPIKFFGHTSTLASTCSHAKNL